MDESPGKVDFLTHINNVRYQEADEQKVFSDFENIRIPFLHLNHLILSKMNTVRMKDKADIEELQKIDPEIYFTKYPIIIYFNTN